jgi:pimeloyl-ACP methyl ester carboxylesterase
MIQSSIPFTDFGGQGDQLHFLHANGYPPACYTPLIEHLKRDFHIIGMHQRPLWPQEKPEGLKDWRLLSEDFLRFLSEYGSVHVIAVGHSVGGIVTLRAALREPDRFRAIILVDPVLFPPYLILTWNLTRALGLGWKVHPMISGAARRRNKFDNLEILYQGYRRRDVFRNFTDEGLRAYIAGMTCPRASGGYELVYSPEWEARIYFTGVWRDLEVWRGLKTLQVPTLFVRGRQSNTFWEKAAARVKRINPGSRMETIENSGHLVPLEHPLEVANLITTFIKELA